MKSLSIVLFLTLSALCMAQEQTLTFTSASDAKFFVYINGKLQNQKSSGMVTVKGLEEKEYHVRVVVDDPFEIATIQSIKPDTKHNEYLVYFNAVKERVSLKPAKVAREEVEWQPEQDTATNAAFPEPAKPSPKVSIRPNNNSDTATRRIIKNVRQQIEDGEL